ncbi:MAG: radical SAM protein [Deltaproteobacteria bacterium]|nr:radical SAM protein [Deltaproteobacteria bacterium]
MINIFITYRCNLACRYCFARELIDEYPQDMDEVRFDTLLSWMRKTALPAAAFIGGEPTLHPDLADMIERTTDAGIAPVLFTNGLFRPGLAERLAPLVSNFVVNYNDPSLYTPVQRNTLRATLSRLHDLGARITFSKNFSHECCEFEYLLSGCEEYGVSSVRYDISRPSASAANDHFTNAEMAGIISHIVRFVKGCEERGIRTGLDCSVRLCDLRVEDRSYLERVSMKFTGVCHPSIDVHPDLSASYCLPMSDIRVADVTAYPNRDALMWHFAELVRPVRQASVSGECFDCRDFMRRCQGGCMALNRSQCDRPDSPACAPNLPEIK